jgi:hypothetical protein
MQVQVPGRGQVVITRLYSGDAEVLSADENEVRVRYPQGQVQIAKLAMTIGRGFNPSSTGGKNHSADDAGH